MGLDMYLSSSKKIDGYEVEDYYRANEFNDVGYWRKANQIHNWFVGNVQDGIDECQLTIVSKEALEELLSRVNKVLEKHSRARTLLPSVGGFFFGGTAYDEYYFENLENTKEIISKVLNETDFEKEIIFYQLIYLKFMKVFKKYQILIDILVMK
jgi:hypothetical protein